MARGKGNGSTGCVVCVILLVTILLAILGIVGLCLAIWQTVDATHTNKDLMNLARQAVEDERLNSAVYVFLAFIAGSLTLGCCIRRNDSDEEESSAKTCFRQVMSLLFLAGYLASGILAALYKSEALPKLEEGMKDLLKEDYFTSGGAMANPEYTPVGRHFNFLQVKRECCGVSERNGGDYAAAGFPARYNLTVPYACCVLKDQKVDARNVVLDDVVDYMKCSTFEAGFFNQETCYEAELSWLTFKTNFLMGYNFTLVALSGLSVLLLTCILICACM